MTHALLAAPGQTGLGCDSASPAPQANPTEPFIMARALGTPTAGRRAAEPHGGSHGAVHGDGLQSSGATTSSGNGRDVLRSVLPRPLPTMGALREAGRDAATKRSREKRASCSPARRWDGSACSVMLRGGMGPRRVLLSYEHGKDECPRGWGRAAPLSTSTPTHSAALRNADTAAAEPEWGTSEQHRATTAQPSASVGERLSSP